MKGWKNDNDPWVPLEGKSGQELSSSSNSKEDDLSRGMPSPTTTTTTPTPLGKVENDVRIKKPTTDPLHDIIDSQRYIQSLEQKLERLKKSKEKPSSRDIINSLALFHDDQMRNYVNSDSVSVDSTFDSDRELTPSYMKRKLFPELQAINVSEITELVKEDFVEKTFERLSLQNNTNIFETGVVKNEAAGNSDECQLNRKDKEDV